MSWRGPETEGRAVSHSGALGEDGPREGSVLSYSLKYTQTDLEFSVGRFVTAQRPTCVRSKLAVAPYSFAITRHFPRKVEAGKVLPVAFPVLLWPISSQLP